MPVEPPQIESRDGLCCVAPFVGRVPELERLCGVLTRARQRRPGLVVIEGPEGVGKTALLRQFLRLAGEPCVLFGSGDEAEASPMYGTSRSSQAIIDASLKSG